MPSAARNPKELLSFYCSDIHDNTVRKWCESMDPKRMYNMFFKLTSNASLHQSNIIRSWLKKPDNNFSPEQIKTMERELRTA